MRGRRPQVHHDEQRRALERFVAERGDRLLRTAALLAGGRADGDLAKLRPTIPPGYTRVACA